MNLPRGRLPDAAAFFFVLIVGVGTCDAAAQEIGDCASPTGEHFLDINNVSARVFNNGGLFAGDYHNYNPSVYRVPKKDSRDALDGAVLWISGLTDSGEHRATSSDFYGREFWPGPLDADGSATDDCSPYDRVYSVGIRDLLLYDELGIVTDDLRDWPVDLGAPVVDGDGIEGNYNLADGDRPELLGHQTLWWIMNDMGGEHISSRTPPIGLEVIGTAFAAAETDAFLNSTTLYKYEIRYAGDEPLYDTYVGMWIDHQSFRYAGIDTTRSMAYSYHSEESQWEGESGPPPAIGLDLLDGPIDSYTTPPVMLGPASFVTDDVHEGAGSDILRQQITGYTFRGDPVLDGCYNYWVVPATCLPDASRRHTGLMYPGDPVTDTPIYQLNVDGNGTHDWISRRDYLLSAGPFTFMPGDTQTVTFSIVWARGTDHLDSITELRAASDRIQYMWDSGKFEGMTPPDLPEPTAAPTLITPAAGVQDQARNVYLHWDRVENATAYLLEFGMTPNLSDARTEIVTTTILRGCDGIRYLAACTEYFDPGTLLSGIRYYWRVRAIGYTLLGPPSPVQQFTTTTGEPLHPVGTLYLSDGSPAFVEVAGPEGALTCVVDPGEDTGCDELGGNLVYNDPNSTNDFFVTGFNFNLDHLAQYAPNDYEIRFASDPAYALVDYSDQIVNVPFTIWNIGNTGSASPNDPTDDIQMIPIVSSSGCDFAFGSAGNTSSSFPGWQATPSFRAYPATTSYGDLAHAAMNAFDPSDDCIEMEGAWDLFVDASGRSPFSYYRLFGNPDGPNFTHGLPAEGTVIRLLSTPNGAGTPAPSAPSDGAIGVAQPVRLYWNTTEEQSGNALEHEIQIATAPDFGEADLIVSEDTRLRQFDVPVLEGNRTYFWRLRSHVNSSGTYSPWSNVWQFSAADPVATRDYSAMPDQVELGQNFPNPFSRSTTIEYHLPRPTLVRLELYNLLGQRIREFEDGFRTAGKHQVVVPVIGLTSGTYFYRLTTGTISQTRKLIIVR